jgi:alkylated DNA nucleotide flippase Atl1
MDHEAYVEAVLRVVESIPPGRVMAYGQIAHVVGRGGPRQVGAVMSAYGSGVPWWRVVRADGTLPTCHQRGALEHYRVEGTPLSGEAAGGSGATRVHMARAAWEPATAAPPVTAGRARP